MLMTMLFSPGVCFSFSVDHDESLRKVRSMSGQRASKVSAVNVWEGLDQQRKWTELGAFFFLFQPGFVCLASRMRRDAFVIFVGCAGHDLIRLQRLEASKVYLTESSSHDTLGAGVGVHEEGEGAIARK
jgi:hypothetical protein